MFLRHTLRLCFSRLRSRPLAGPSALLLLTLFLVPLAVNGASPFRQRTPIQEESLTLTAGDVFEMLPLTDLSFPRYSWILTLDREFLQAGQAPVFRKRLLKPGKYILNVEIRGTGDEGVIRRAVNIHVKSQEAVRDGGEDEMAADSQTLVKITPSPNRLGYSVLPTGKRLITLTPIEKAGTPLHLDLSPFIDENSDGNTENDINNAGTFFQSERTPIHLLFGIPLEAYTIIVHSTLSSGQDISQRIQVVEQEYAQKQGLLTGEAYVVFESKEGGVVDFSVNFDGGQSPGVALLYTWDFGDGGESLVEAPSHTYGSDGTYDVKLVIRNLENGPQLRGNCRNRCDCDCGLYAHI